MALKDINFRKAENITQEMYEPLMITNAVQGVANTPSEPSVSFKGEVESKKIKFPEELGEAHPFDFAITEGLYKSFGFATGVIDKYVDYIVGPGFWVSSEDERATELITQWMQDVNFDTVLRSWVKEGLVKNGFLELGGKEGESVKGAKVLDSKWMYVDRNKKGVVEGYNQYKGGFDKFAKDKVLNFKPFQVAHIAFNKIGDMPYGMGILYPAMNTVNNLLQNESDLHMLMHRKANTPYHVKLGGVVGGKYFKPNPTTVAAFGKDLEWLNNKHEWVTDGLTEIKVIDFGNIGEKFNEVLKYDTEMLLYTFQVPSVLMGTANINEGIAKVQMDGFERRIKSFQAEIEKVIEEKIFKRVLQANGFDVHVEFNWGRPSNTERYERLMKIIPLLTSQTTSHSLSRLLEKETVKILELDEDEFQEMADEEEIKRAEEEEKQKELERIQPIVPGQNKSPPQRKATEDFTETVCPHCIDIEENLDKYNSVEEWLGFNYKDYVKNIEDFIKGDEFDLVRATNAVEEAAGKLSGTQIVELKKVLEKGFKKGSSISDMTKEVNKKVGLKDLLKMEDGQIVRKAGIPTLVRRAENRGVSIVRSEVTRVANAGAIKHFKEGGVSKIRWVASFGTRTCLQCEALDGIIFDIDSHPDLPLHTMCRCTVVPVTELS